MPSGAPSPPQPLASEWNGQLAELWQEGGGWRGGEREAAGHLSLESCLRKARGSSLGIDGNHIFLQSSEPRVIYLCSHLSLWLVRKDSWRLLAVYHLQRMACVRCHIACSSKLQGREAVDISVCLLVPSPPRAVYLGPGMHVGFCLCRGIVCMCTCVLVCVYARICVEARDWHRYRPSTLYVLRHAFSLNPARVVSQLSVYLCVPNAEITGHCDYACLAFRWVSISGYIFRRLTFF